MTLDFRLSTFGLSCLHSFLVSLARKILGNTFWQIFGRLVTAVIAFVTVGFLTNYWGAGNVALGQAKYGTYAYIYEYLAIFGALADLGIFTIAVREMSKQAERRAEIFASTITLRIVTLVLAMLICSLIAYLIPQYVGTEIPRGVAIAALGTGLFILSGTLSTILLIHLQMRFHAIALILGKILTFALILGIIFHWSTAPTTASFYNLIWAGTIGSFLTLVMTWYGAQKFLPIRPKWDRKLATELFMMALPFGIATFMNTVYFRLDITMMGLILPRSAATGECLARFCGDQQAGIYAVAVRIMEVLIILPLYFMNSILPSLSASIAAGNKEQVERRLALPFVFLFIVGLPAVIGLFLLARPIVHLITPEDFGSDVALKILTIPMLTVFFTTFFSFALIAFGQQKKLLWINLWALLFNFFLNLWAIPRYGFVGASYTTLLSEGLILALSIYFFRQNASFPIFWRRFGGTAFAGLVMGLATFWSWQAWGETYGAKALAVIIPESALIYFALLFATRVIDRDFLKMLRKESDVIA